MPVLFYADMHAAWREVIGLAWPEVPANGIYHSKELARIPFQEKAAAGELPFAVIDYDLDPTGQLGVSNRSERGLVTVTRVFREDDDWDGQMEQAEILRNTIKPDDHSNPFAVGQVFGNPKITGSVNSTVNLFLLSTMRPFYSVAVISDYVVSYRP